MQKVDYFMKMLRFFAIQNFRYNVCSNDYIIENRDKTCFWKTGLSLCNCNAKDKKALTWHSNIVFFNDELKLNASIVQFFIFRNIFIHWIFIYKIVPYGKQCYKISVMHNCDLTQIQVNLLLNQFGLF
jgi:hypothetical protein